MSRRCICIECDRARFLMLNSHVYRMRQDWRLSWHHWIADASGYRPRDQIQPAPAGGEGLSAAEPKARRCNRHSNCDAADLAASAKGRRPHHCYSDDCEDCFGC